MTMIMYYKLSKILEKIIVFMSEYIYQYRGNWYNIWVREFRLILLFIRCTMTDTLLLLIIEISYFVYVDGIEHECLKLDITFVAESVWNLPFWNQTLFCVESYFYNFAISDSFLIFSILLHGKLNNFKVTCP